MPDQKKVALLISSFLPNLGGMEVGLHNIAINLEEQGWTPVIIAPYSHVKALEQKSWDLPYTVEAVPPKIWTILYHWPWLGFKIANFYLNRLNKKHRFDFWHVTMGYPTGCAIVHYDEWSIKKNKKSIPYLIRCAGEDIQKKPEIGYGMRLNPKLDNIITSCLRRAERVTAITKSVFQDYKDIGIPTSNISNIPNGVPCDRFSKDDYDVSGLKQLLNIKDNETLILCVGRNHPKKNYQGLLATTKVLVEQGKTGIKVICVGKDCEELKPLVQEYGLADNVILLNQMGDAQTKTEQPLSFPSDDLITLYKAADIFAFPSLTETFGIVIVEAMAAGLPVIVGDSEGCRDIVEKGKWGMMCDPQNPEDLASKIEELISDPDLYKQFQKKSLERSAQFDWGSIAQRYIDIYEKEIQRTSKDIK